LAYVSSGIYNVIEQEETIAESHHSLKYLTLMNIQMYDMSV